VCHYDESRDLRSQLPYDIDGVVLKIDNCSFWSQIPRKTATPGYARVHKPIPWISGAETVVQAITIQVGRTGVLTPVAELTPVFVQGSTVSRATLHNAAEILAKDIRIGDTVIVRKAGMVIPEVVEVVKGKRLHGSAPFDFVAHIQNKCPACGSIIVKQKVSSGKKEEVAWRCENIACCPAQRARRIMHFSQKNALDIEGLGGVVAGKLSENELVKDPVGLFGLKVHQLASLNLGTKNEPRIFGEKNAARIIEALDKARSLPLARWLHALGIPNVGEKIAYGLARLHSDFEDLAASNLILTLSTFLASKDAKAKHESEFLSELKKRLSQNSALEKQAECEKVKIEFEIEGLKKQLEDVKHQFAFQPDKLIKKKITSISGKIERREDSIRTVGLPDGISSVVSKSVLEYFSSLIGKQFLAQLKHFGLSPHGELGQADAGFAGTGMGGKTFVLTGTLDSMSRDEATELIRKRGGDVVGAVSRNTDFVVCGTDPGASKLRDAEKHGVTQINEAEFREMLGTIEVKLRHIIPVQQTLF
jgi:DNA ligase (NAD+)